MLAGWRSILIKSIIILWGANRGAIRIAADLSKKISMNNLRSFSQFHYQVLFDSLFHLHRFHKTEFIFNKSELEFISVNHFFYFSIRFRIILIVLAMRIFAIHLKIEF